MSYANQKLPYECTVTMPGLVYDETAQTLMMDTVQFAATGTVPVSVFIEVNTIDTMSGTTTVGSDTIALNDGIGTYSLAPSLAVISAVDNDNNEYIEILVYTDDTRVQLVARLYVHPVAFVF